MPSRLDPRTDILPKPQQQTWPLLAPTPQLSFVLYGGTAVALHLGHRTSVDFDFFRSAPLDEASRVGLRSARFNALAQAENLLAQLFAGQLGFEALDLDE